MSEFKVGDRVEVIQNGSSHTGKLGAVIGRDEFNHNKVLLDDFLYAYDLDEEGNVDYESDWHDFSDSDLKKYEVPGIVEDAVVPERQVEAVERIIQRGDTAQSLVDPDHYKTPGGAEVIDITRYLGFLEGNVVKYVARAGRKGDRLTDLLKAQKYLNWAIEDAGGAR